MRDAGSACAPPTDADAELENLGTIASCRVFSAAVGHYVSVPAADFGTSWQMTRPLPALAHRSTTPSLRVAEMSDGCAILGGCPH